MMPDFSAGAIVVVVVVCRQMEFASISMVFSQLRIF